MGYKIKYFIDIIDKKIISQSARTKIIFIFIICLISFLFMLKLNRMTPMWTDDYVYSFIYETQDRISSLKDILYSQYRHYMMWGGRLVAHSIVQGLLTLSLLEQDILNSLVYVFLTILIYFHAKGKNKNQDVILFILINILLWFLQPAFGECMLWITGSANYLWCTTIILGFLLPYRLYSGISKSSILKSIVMFLLGIIAGWTNENVALAMIVIVILWLFYYKKEKYAIPAWAICGLIGAITGYLFMALAPGNFVRIEVIDRKYSLFMFYYRFNVFTKSFVHILGYINILSFILLILVLKFSRISRTKVIFLSGIYFIGLLATIYSMLLSPTFPNRAWFGGVCLNIIMFGIIFYNLNREHSFIRYIKYGILCMAIFSFIFDFYYSYKDIKAVNNQWIERDQIIQEGIKSGASKVEVYSIHPGTKYGAGDYPDAAIHMTDYYGIYIEMDGVVRRK